MVVTVSRYWGRKSAVLSGDPIPGAKGSKALPISDAYGMAIEPGKNYVAYLYIELLMEYKRLYR